MVIGWLYYEDNKRGGDPNYLCTEDPTVNPRFCHMDVMDDGWDNYNSTQPLMWDMGRSTTAEYAEAALEMYIFAGTY